MDFPSDDEYIHTSPPESPVFTSDGGADPIPTLHNAFLIGEILTKCDCLSVRSLYPRTRIINMYGSPETQRAVSYFSIEARPQA
ncbi:hypothetical protein B0H16DRAFT_1743397 [Mycena metata]|uniref:Uncharacterized protein n=1 Tax=Mycena metata TaxID=1033252 RepID=A0AAD7H6M6_9AGAR|nr:hypothetical protein B0H16DRAFT_1743397 [Mycena metata]